MKRIIHFFIFILFATTMYAEDVLQVVPFKAQRGTVSADACYFSIAMNNDAAEIWAFQFEMLLPQGMALDNTDGLEPFELGDRCPYTTGRGGVKNWKHTVQYSLLDDGWYRVVVFTTDADRISGNSGEVLRAYYLTNDNMEEGVHSICIRNTVLTISGNSDIKPANSSSYCTVGDFALNEEGVANFSMLTGYIPSWVVSSVIADVSNVEALSALDMRNADALGAAPVLPNKNVLCYVKQGALSQDSSADNVVECGEGYSCEKFSIYDGGGNFYSPVEVECGLASFDREFKAGFWSTVVLPFNVNEEQMAEIKLNGVEVEKLVSYDGENNTLCFESVQSMQANVPYIIRCNDAFAPFVDIETEAFASTDNMAGISLDGVSMNGNYGNISLSSDGANTYYVFDALNGEFVRVGNNCKVSPFRAYISIPAAMGSNRAISLSHIGNGTTAVQNNFVQQNSSYDIYTIQGVKVGEIESISNPFTNFEKGIYIVGNKKIVVK